MKAKVRKIVKETKDVALGDKVATPLADRPALEKLKKFVKSDKSIRNEDHLIKELYKAFSKPGNGKKQIEIERELTTKALTLYSLDNFYGLSSAVGGTNAERAIRFAQELYKEYDCKTASEKTLAQMIAIANERILEYSGRLNFYILSGRIDPNMNQHTSILSKELDRATRHFTTLLSTLKQIKSPSFQVNVKTNTAFVAQNQQINANTSLAENEKTRPNENINV